LKIDAVYKTRGLQNKNKEMLSNDVIAGCTGTYLTGVSE
jgi:hypothetical protein